MQYLPVRSIPSRELTRPARYFKWMGLVCMSRGATFPPLPIAY
jgi:hypothetical protein